MKDISDAIPFVYCRHADGALEMRSTSTNTAIIIPERHLEIFIALIKKAALKEKASGPLSEPETICLDHFF